MQIGIGISMTIRGIGGGISAGIAYLFRAHIPIYGQSLSLGVNPNTSEIVSIGSDVTITGATQTNPVVVTAAGHGFSNGDTVYIDSIVGMTQINNRTFEVTNATADTFNLYKHDGAIPSVTSVDGAAFTAYTSGGVAAKVDTSDIHVMFNGGVRPHYDDLDVSNVNTNIYANTMQGLVPLAERSLFSDPDYGETFATGAGKQNVNPLIFSATGRGAYKIAELSRDTAAGFFHFSNTYASVLAARDLTVADGKEFILGPMIWMQGEADGGAATTKATYKTLLEDMRSDFETHLKHASLQDISPFKMITSQQALNNANYAEIAVAVLELHRSNANLPCAGPAYWVPYYVANNDVHMTATGYRVYGGHLGRVIKTILDGDTWHPCHINAQPTRAGTTITVPVYVPEGALVKDTTLVATVANDGFAYTGAGIISVTITDDGATDNAGVITIEIDAAAAGTLRFAYNNGSIANYIGPVFGSRGNIRDSSTLVSEHNGDNLYNWLCTDQWEIA